MKGKIIMKGLLKYSQWIDAMKEIGMNYKYIELPEGDHGTVISDGMPDIFKFFAENPKAGTNK